MPRLTTRLAYALVVVVFCGLFVQAVLRLFYLPGVPGLAEIALTTGYLLAALVLQLAYFSRPGTQLRSRTSYLLLGLLALMVFLPWLQFQRPWVGLGGFLAGSALLVLRPALGWSVFVGVVVSVALTQAAFGADSARVIGQDIIIAADLGLITYGLTWMARTVRQLRAARQAQAEVALAETRLRFARDLHDLLGLSLSAIALKCDLAYRVLPRDPARAMIELESVLKVARHALADVRSVSDGYHVISLADECQSAQSLLTTAGLDLRMDVPAASGYDRLPPTIGTALAMVLREGVTNVLRHADAARCEITLNLDQDTALLGIVNDGVTEPEAAVHRGSGIRNMSDRVGALRGVLAAGYEDDGRFGLWARIPLPEQTSERPGREDALTAGGPAHRIDKPDASINRP